MTDKKYKLIFIVVLTGLLVGASFIFLNFDDEKIDTQETVEVASAKKIFTVFVSGQVKNSAVVKLEDNGDLRLVDAVNAAGGLTEFADTEIVNLAEPLTDGAHIHIPTKEIIFQESLESQISASTSSGGDLININTADETELQKLYRVGPAIAKRIVEYRTQNGKFQTIEDIKKVRGIGQKTFEKMKDKITVN